MVSRRKAKKQRKEQLINKKVFQHIIKNSELCQHAIKELKFAGYGNGEGGPNDWMYRQVLEAIAVFSSHDNSGTSAYFEINLVNKLCKFDIISPLRFTDNEWGKINVRGTCQNKRKSGVFKEPNGKIHYLDAFVKQPIKSYSIITKKWSDYKPNITFYGGLYEHKGGIFTGRYFNKCYIKQEDINKGWIPKSEIVIKCVEIEINTADYIMVVDSNDNINLNILSNTYDIEWLNCPSIKGIKLEDATPDFEEKTRKEMKL